MADPGLEAFISEVTGESQSRVEDDLGDGFVRLRTAEAERRQAKHDIRCSEDVLIELLRNARDAHAGNIFVAVSKEGPKRTIVVVDDGDGIPDRMTGKIFEARVTNKLDTVHMDTWGVHGRGMALYAISMNALSARVAATVLGGGSSFVVTTDTNALSERADQSTRPLFARSETGTVTVRGPRNLCRTAAEFAYIERAGLNVYFGSAIDIAAALWEFGRESLSASARAFCEDTASVGVCRRLALASDPDDFAGLAGSLGLELSPRSARRIMDGQIPPVAPMASQIEVHEAGAAGKQPGKLPPTATSEGESPEPTGAHADGGDGDDAARIARVMGATRAPSVRLSEADARSLARAAERAWGRVAGSYYLDPDVKAKVQVRGGEVRITLPALPSDL